MTALLEMAVADPEKPVVLPEEMPDHEREHEEEQEAEPVLPLEPDEVREPPSKPR